MEFRSKGTEGIYDGVDSKGARRTLPIELHAKAARLLDRLARATVPDDLRIPTGNRLERLRGDREGQWSVRINDQYRICFRWQNDEAIDVEIVDYH